MTLELLATPEGKSGGGPVGNTTASTASVVNNTIFNDYTLPGFVLEWRWGENKKIIRTRNSENITPHEVTQGEVVGEIGLHDKLQIIQGFIFCFIDPRNGLKILKVTSSGVEEKEFFTKEYVFDGQFLNSVNWAGEDADGQIFLITIEESEIALLPFDNVSCEDSGNYRLVELKGDIYSVVGNRIIIGKEKKKIYR